MKFLGFLLQDIKTISPKKQSQSKQKAGVLKFNTMYGASKVDQETDIVASTPTLATKGPHA